MRCRHCGSREFKEILDLGYAPPSNSYRTPESASRPETYFPLRVLFCGNCLLVQTEDFASREELFTSDYAYLSSASLTWQKHTMEFVQDITKRLNLDESNFVVELASNDGCLLENFLNLRIPCLGVEPAVEVADVAASRGIPVIKEFFGQTTAEGIVQTWGRADLIVGNNVLAHVPDINDFVMGIKTLLSPSGTVSLEFPHLLNLIRGHQFDTVYHEHFSYLSLLSVRNILNFAGLKIFDVEQIDTHGGSLRVLASHDEDIRGEQPAVQKMLQEEIDARLVSSSGYISLQEEASRIRDEILSFLVEQKKLGKTVVGFGAAAKGTTLLNFAGVRKNLLGAVFDSAASKQGKFLPGSHIPVLHPDRINDFRPDYILILPWNLEDEITAILRNSLKNKAKVVVAIPRLKIIDL